MRNRVTLRVQLASSLALIMACTGCAQIQRTQALYDLRSGVKAYQEGDRAASLKALDRSIALDPEDPDARAVRGGVLVVSGQGLLALADLDEALRLDPKHVPALVNRCSAKAALQRSTEALADCDEAIRLEPANAVARRARATIMVDNEEYQRAANDLDEAIRLDPGNGNDYGLRCYIRRHLKQYSEAWADCDHAVALAPKANHYRLRAAASRDNGKLDAALRDFGEAIRLDPTRLSLRLDRAEVREWVGDITGAIEDLRLVADEPVQTPLARIDRGIALMQLGRYAEARREFEQGYAATLGRERSYAASNPAWLYATAPESGVRGGREALAFGKEALQLAGAERPGLLEALAAANAELAQFDAAIRYQEKAIGLTNPNHAFSLDRARTRLALYRAAKPYRDRPLTSTPSGAA